MFKSIGSRFKKETSKWLAFYPEIIHQWTDKLLIVCHPKKPNKNIIFEVSKKRITVKSGEISKTYSDDFFKKVKVNEILGFMMNVILTKNDKRFIKPNINEYQVAMLITNQYGQVLTSNFNMFNGWGNVYRKFENIEFAKKYIHKIKVDNAKSYEATIYNKDYEIIYERLL